MVVDDLEVAPGQFLLHRTILEAQEPSRVLFLVVPDEPTKILTDPVGQLLMARHLIQAVVFDPRKEEILQGIP